jgi:hypothetical protein
MLIQEVSHKDLKEDWFGKVHKINEEEAGIWNKKLKLCWPWNTNCVPLESSFWPTSLILKKKNESRLMWCLCCLCVYVSLPVTNLFMNLGMYIMALEPISMVYFINPSRQSVCLYVYPISLVGNGLLKIPLLLLSDCLVKALLQQRIFTHLFSVPCTSYQGK